MGQFRFKEKVLRLQIEDREIQIPADSAFAKKWHDLGQDIIVQVNAIKDKEGLTEDELIDLMDSKLTEALGEENMMAIFSGRELDLYDQTELVSFISSELNAYRLKNMKKLADTTKPNTAQKPQMAMAMKGEAPLEVVGSARNKYKK
ncbi:hypothetical protein [Chakrabartyella piscis]|uniref:hypothetical protein n=1 Tax=Chakrabartyella piscis TaxID=2918914 RepID=UPI002958D534|nr:hypothetical protein [Chakrabartyella piscis]